MARNFDEAFVKAEVMTNGILPALLVFAIIGKVFHDELIDAV